MATYRYKTWSGGVAVVDAYSVAFEPGYVVFSDIEGRIVHAEAATNCLQLTNDAAVGTSTRRLLPPNPPPEES